MQRTAKSILILNAISAAGVVHLWWAGHGPEALGCGIYLAMAVFGAIACLRKLPVASLWLSGSGLLLVLVLGWQQGLSPGGPMFLGQLVIVLMALCYETRQLGHEAQAESHPA